MILVACYCGLDLSFGFGVVCVVWVWFNFICIYFVVGGFEFEFG